jgi:PAS domain S-box-containing protein
MTIGNRLRISSLLYIAVTLAIGFALIMGLGELQRDREQARTNYALVTGLLDLTTLTDDCLAEPASRSLRQWQAKSGDVGRLLEKLGGMEVFESERTGRLVKAHERISSLFSQLMSLHEKIRPGESRSTSSTQLMARLNGMLGMELQSMVSDASQLYRAGQIRIDRHLQRAQWVIILFFGVTALIILGNHIVTRKSVIEPLGRLTGDTAIIGMGDLDHVVAVTSSDEIGYLGQAFNRMTGELRKLYEALEAENRERKLAQEELSRHRDHLEDLVQKRSHELRRTNEELEREIEERKRAEQGLRNEKYLSDMTIDSLPGIFYLFDDHGRFLRWNKNFQKTSGYSAEEIAHMHPLDLFVDDDRRAIEEAIEGVFVNGESAAEAHLVSRTGTRTPYFFAGVRMTLDGTVCLIGTGIDVTELKQAESAVARYVKELERTNAELAQFAFVSSHHLQEPLRKIINYSQLFERRYKQHLDQRADRYLDYVVDGALRMRALIEDLQTFTGLDRAEPVRERVNVNGVVRKILLDIDDTVTATGAVVTSDELPFISADAKEMNQLFQNLITNALKFHGPEAPLIHISAEKSNSEWTFSVRDNGMGIEPQYQEQIFGIFQRLHKAGEYPGTGIGAALCKKVVERHGGRIWVESKSGSGSTFSFTIPAQ